MGERLQKYLKQIKEIWNNLNNKAKIIIGLGVIGVSVALIFMIILGGQTGYQPLFTQLSSRDADAIVKNLDDKGISYKLEDNGATILVPSDKVHKTRLDMAGEGLPTQGVVGFEIFDQSQFGTTDFERKINYYRAIGGELSRSIRSMEAVDFARVQLSPPQESIFQENEKPAEASVLLKLKPGISLSKNQVNAISNLVASSVRGLDKEKVTIVDTAGNLLAAYSEDDNYHTGNTINHFEIQRRFEEGLKQDLTGMLSKVLGPDNFTIEVNAHLNFDQRQVESETYAPVVDDEGIARSREEQEESYEGENTAAAGVPGTTSNTPQYQGIDTDNINQISQEKTSIITNYEINKKIDRHVYAPGSVERLSVSVIINKDMENDVLEKIKNSIEAAVGYNPERNDLVTVTKLPFDQSLEEEMAQARVAARAAKNKEMYLYAGLIALILITLLILFFVFRSDGEIKKVRPGQTVDMIAGGEVEKAEKEAAATELSEEDKKRQQIKEELKDLVTDQPQEVAQILKSWLTEE